MGFGMRLLCDSPVRAGRGSRVTRRGLPVWTGSLVLFVVVDIHELVQRMFHVGLLLGEHEALALIHLTLQIGPKKHRAS